MLSPGAGWTCPDPSLSCLYSDGSNCWRRPNGSQTLCIGDSCAPHSRNPCLFLTDLLARMVDMVTVTPV